jgi:hypothetical protein
MMIQAALFHSVQSFLQDLALRTTMIILCPQFGVGVACVGDHMLDAVQDGVVRGRQPLRETQICGPHQLYGHVKSQGGVPKAVCGPWFAVAVSQRFQAFLPLLTGRPVQGAIGVEPGADPNGSRRDQIFQVDLLPQ